MEDFKSYYDVLEVSKSGTQDDIKKAFYKLANEYHPDKNTNATDKLRDLGAEKFKEINEAYDVLRNSSKRKQYDAKLKEFEDRKQQAKQHSQTSSSSSTSTKNNYNNQTHTPRQSYTTTPTKKKNSLKVWLWAIGIFVLLAIIGSFSGSGNTTPISNNYVTPRSYPNNNYTSTVNTNATDSPIVSPKNSDVSVPDTTYVPNSPQPLSSIPAVSDSVAPTNVSGCITGGAYSETNGLSCSGDGSCAPGSTYDNGVGQCVTPLQYCQNKDGVYATYDSVSNSCGCDTGYTLNSKNTCALPETGYQICNDMNATWNGYSYTKSGGFSCTCDKGYTSSSDGKTCVAVVRSGYEVCSEDFTNMTWDGTYSSDGKYNCVCNMYSTWNSSSQSCVSDF